MESSNEKQKTPASILHEEMTKKSIVPAYELIVDGTGTRHPQIFTYKLTCYKEIVTGSGNCKKKAKQEAANKMLEKLKLTSCSSEISSDSQLTILESFDEELLQPLIDDSNQNNLLSENLNPVQVLMKLCFKHSLPAPEFETSFMGPTHAPCFTTRCTVSNFLEEGYASIKKISKRNSALKMINAIQEEKSISIRPEDKIESECSSLSPKVKKLLSLAKTAKIVTKDENHFEKMSPENIAHLKKNVPPEIESQLAVVKESIEKLLQLI